MTVTEASALPPAPVQVTVNVVCDTIAGDTWLPEVASAPLQPPLAVQPVAFVLDQLSVTVPPELTCIALDDSVAVGLGGVGATSTPYVPAVCVEVSRTSCGVPSTLIT